VPELELAEEAVAPELLPLEPDVAPVELDEPVLPDEPALELLDVLELLELLDPLELLDALEPVMLPVLVEVAAAVEDELAPVELDAPALAEELPMLAPVVPELPEVLVEVDAAAEALLPLELDTALEVVELLDELLVELDELLPELELLVPVAVLVEPEPEVFELLALLELPELAAPWLEALVLLEELALLLPADG
jgi:hypothetical protein